MIRKHRAHDPRVHCSFGSKLAPRRYRWAFGLFGERDELVLSRSFGGCMMAATSSATAGVDCAVCGCVPRRMVVTPEAWPIGKHAAKGLQHCAVCGVRCARMKRSTAAN